MTKQLEPKVFTRVQVTAVEEKITKFHLSDGTTIVGRMFPTEIFRTELVDDNGFPMYCVKQTQLMYLVESIPEELKPSSVESKH